MLMTFNKTITNCVSVTAGREPKDSASTSAKVYRSQNLYHSIEAWKTAQRTHSIHRELKSQPDSAAVAISWYSWASLLLLIPWVTFTSCTQGSIISRQHDDERFLVTNRVGVFTRWAWKESLTMVKDSGRGASQLAQKRLRRCSSPLLSRTLTSCRPEWTVPNENLLSSISLKCQLYICVLGIKEQKLSFFHNHSVDISIGALPEVQNAYSFRRIGIARLSKVWSRVLPYTARIIILSSGGWLFDKNQRNKPQLPIPFRDF